MTLEETPSTEQPRKLYQKDDLQTVVESPAWQDLTPNFKDARALHPRDLDFFSIEMLANHFIENPELLDRVYEHEQLPYSFEIPDVGEITFVGKGEQKVVFKFTSTEGKSLAIILSSGYNFEGVEVPGDPRIHKVFQKLTADGDVISYEYSDLRTYLSLPVGYRRYPIGIHFQEFAHHQSLRSNFLAKKGSIGIAQSRVRRYVEKRGFRVADSRELDKNRHFLVLDGLARRIAVIDVLLQKLSNHTTL